MYHSVTSRMPRGSLRNGAGTRAMSPSAVPPKLAITAAPGGPRGVHVGLDRGQVVSASGLELLEVVGHVQVVASSKCCWRMIASKK